MRPRFSSSRSQAFLLTLAWAGLCSPARAPAQDILSGYAPANLASPYGLLSVVRLTTGLVELAPKILVYAPPGVMRNVQFSENVWVLGYQTSIVDETGRA